MVVIYICVYVKYIDAKGNNLLYTTLIYGYYIILHTLQKKSFYIYCRLCV